MVANLNVLLLLTQKLVSLKLHMIGYDRVPVAVYQIHKKI